MENGLLGALIVLIAFCLGMLFEFFLHIKEMVAYVKEVNKANSAVRQFEKKIKQLESEYQNAMIMLRADRVEVKIVAGGGGNGNDPLPDVKGKD